MRSVNLPRDFWLSLALSSGKGGMRERRAYRLCIAAIIELRTSGKNITKEIKNERPFN